MQEDIYILFEDYLSGNLLPEEKTAFEKQLENNANLFADFKNYKATTAFMTTAFAPETVAFKSNLEAIADQHFKKTKNKTISLKTWHYAVAASVAVLFGVFLMQLTANPSFEDYNQHENASFTERSDVNADLTQAEEAFNAKQYQQAIPLFQSVIKVKNTPEIHYFYGLSLLENNNITQAQSVFEQLQKGSSLYKFKATWNLALIQLKQKNYSGCKTILQTIPPDYEDFETVQKLLKSLN